MDLNKRMAKIKEEMQEMPEKAKMAIYWIIENYDFFLEMCKESKMTDEEIEKYKEKAREKKDYTALALLCVVQIYKNGQL